MHMHTDSLSVSVSDNMSVSDNIYQMTLSAQTPGYNKRHADGRLCFSHMRIMRLQCDASEKVTVALGTCSSFIGNF